MKTLIRGKIVDLIPFFNGSLNNSGSLLLSEKGDICFTVDTGFSGGIALSEEVLDKMDVEFFGYNTFTLATGDMVELPMFLGKVILGGHQIEIWFIPGDSLLGMEFLTLAGSELLLNFQDETVKLLG